MAKYLIWGLGKSGRSALNLLQAKNITCYSGDDARGDRWEDYLDLVDTVVLSPGIPPRHPLWQEALLRDKEVIGELELAWRFFKGTAVAVTGTDGKSTTVRLTWEILRRRFPEVYEGGNAGTPFSSIVLKNPDCIAVLEVSSFQGKTLKTFRPRAGAFLNFSPDHIDWHRDLKDYLESKYRIFAHQREEDLFVAGSSQKEVIETPTRAKKIIAEPSNSPFEPSLLRLRGKHNLINAVTAVTIAMELGAQREEVEDAIRSFRGLPFRMELVARHRGIEIYNDSKSTTPNSLRAALESFPEGSVILIAGGKDKGADFSIIRDIARSRVKRAVLIGETKEKIKEAIGDLCDTLLAPDLEEAVKLALKTAKAGDSVLFSPGCSSFDMFESYIHRGEVFNRIVKDIIRSSDGGTR